LQIQPGGEVGSLDVLGRLDAGGPKRQGREPHEPLVELVNGEHDVPFPKVRLVGVDALGLHLTVNPKRHDGGAVDKSCSSI